MYTLFICLSLYEDLETMIWDKWVEEEIVSRWSKKEDSIFRSIFEKEKNELENRCEKCKLV
jgi:hypothetical protein